MKKNKQLLPLNLQHFATEPPVDPPADPPADPPKKIELTQEEIDKQVESESDRKLQSALSKKQAEWDAETQKKIDDAISEQQRLSTLSQEEAYSEKLKIREQEIEEKEQQMKQRELLSEARADLVDKELPAEFADMLVASDAETTLSNIKTFHESFDNAVNEAVKEKVRQVTPPAGGKGGKGQTVADTFADARNKAKSDVQAAPNPWATGE